MSRGLASFNSVTHSADTLRTPRGAVESRRLCSHRRCKRRTYSNWVATSASSAYMMHSCSDFDQWSRLSESHWLSEPILTEAGIQHTLGVLHRHRQDWASCSRSQ